jgi:hypothetical protein
MNCKTLVALFLLGVASILPAVAQMGTGQAPGRYGTTSTTTGQNGRGNRQPCWQVAGVSKSAMEQERSLHESARSQMEAVCSNSSMTPQQKHEEMRKIEESVHQRMSSIVTPQQQSALQSCRASRGEATHMGAMHGGGGMHGGMQNCGEMPGRGTGTGTGTGMPAPQPGVHN